MTPIGMNIDEIERIQTELSKAEAYGIKPEKVEKTSRKRHATEEETKQFKQDVETLIRKYGGLEQIPLEENRSFKEEFGVTLQTYRQYYSGRLLVSPKICQITREYVLGMPEKKLDGIAATWFDLLMHEQFKLGQLYSRLSGNGQDITINQEYMEKVHNRDIALNAFKREIERS